MIAETSSKRTVQRPSCINKIDPLSLSKINIRRILLADWYEACVFGLPIKNLIFVPWGHLPFSVEGTEPCDVGINTRDPDVTFRKIPSVFHRFDQKKGFHVD